MTCDHKNMIDSGAKLILSHAVNEIIFYKVSSHFKAKDLKVLR